MISQLLTIWWMCIKLSAKTHRNQGIWALYNFVRSVQNFLQGEYSSLSYLNCLQFGEKLYQTFCKITFVKESYILTILWKVYKFFCKKSTLVYGISIAYSLVKSVPNVLYNHLYSMWNITCLHFCEMCTKNSVRNVLQYVKS